jgi:tripartite-type tricarboxylate transporter receptor subunit TctC
MHAARCRLLAGCALAIYASVATGAETFPTKAIRIIGIATPGSPSDVIGRAVAEPLSRQVGQPVVVESRAGAGGTIAAATVARSEPDGHTVLLTSSAQSGMPWLYSNPGFDPVRDFAGVTPLVSLPNVLVAPPQRGWNALKDLVSAARAQPGSLNFGSGGTGSGTHLNSEKFMLAAGITANHVPYKGTAEGVVEVIAGRLDWFYAPAAAVIALIKDGKLKGLTVSTKARMSLLPDLPTVAEAGLADAEYVFWIGIMVPRKTPRPAISRLNEETHAILRSPAMRERIRQIGAEAFPLRPEEFDAFLAADAEATGRIVKAANVKPQ